MYNAGWSTRDAVEIELHCIAQGGEWRDSKGQKCGNGLFYHVRKLQQLLWPNKTWHKWNNLLLENFCKHPRVGILGPASSGKTHESACYALLMYYARPNETTVMCSSTTRDMLQLRIWGEIKKYHKMAKERVPWLPGNMIESKLMLTTDNKTVEGREFRNGIVGLPCKVGGELIGLGSYAGIKNTYVYLFADESQFMTSGFFDAISNLSANPHFQLIAMGNPKDPTDPLGKVCEPENGWESVDRTRMTKTWRTRLPNGICVQLVGTDSPNYDVPEGHPPPFPYLITRKKIEEDQAYYGTDSLQFMMMDMGEMPMSGFLRRVITRAMCIKNHALEDVVWDSAEKITKIIGMDISCGGVGGDRTVMMELWFGPDITGKQILAVKDQPIVLSVANDRTRLAEEQIVLQAKEHCLARGIPPENVYFDGTGRSAVMSQFAKLWSPFVVPIEFGGRATDRPVRSGTTDLCRDKYGKFVTELWFRTRLIIEAGQMRNLPESVMEEGQLREFIQLPSGKVDVEPKDKTRERMGRSPDLFDALVSGCEGCIRRGFLIEALGKNVKKQSAAWLTTASKEWKDSMEKKDLSYATR